MQTANEIKEDTQAARPPLSAGLGGGSDAPTILCDCNKPFDNDQNMCMACGYPIVWGNNP